MAMYRDCLGNSYRSVPGAKTPPGSRGSKKGRKIGSKKRKPSFLRWKDRFSRGLGLKHRRAARRAKVGAAGAVAV